MSFVCIFCSGIKTHEKYIMQTDCCNKSFCFRCNSHGIVSKKTDTYPYCDNCKQKFQYETYEIKELFLEKKYCFDCQMISNISGRAVNFKCANCIFCATYCPMHLPEKCPNCKT